VGERVPSLGAEERDEREVDRDRARHATDCRQEGHQRLAPPERATLQDDGLPDLLGGDGEEERHQHVIDEVVEREGTMVDRAVGGIDRITHR
jgi:hypothetical protein